MSGPVACDKHPGTAYQRREVYDSPGKTMDVCPECERETRERLLELCSPYEYPDPFADKFLRPAARPEGK